MLKNFRTYQLALCFYKKGQGLRLQGPIKNQYERALLSIVLNLSEGSAKPSWKERRRYYLSALGSFREVQSILEITDFKGLTSDSDRLGAHLYCLCYRHRNS